MTTPKKPQVPVRRALPPEAAPRPQVSRGATIQPVLKVRALRAGYYNHKRRREGDVFVLRHEKDFGSWMEWTDPAVRTRITGAQAALTAATGTIAAEKAGLLPRRPIEGDQYELSPDKDPDNLPEVDPNIDPSALSPLDGGQD
jgi:hypothetical protein